MNIKSILGILSIILLFLSCAKEQGNDDSYPTGDEGNMEFRVECESTRAVLDGLSVDFEPGDAIAIWDGVSLRRFEAVQTGDGLVFRGNAVDTDSYFALYPWSEDCLHTSISGTPVFKTLIPRIQRARKGSFATGSNVAVGRGGRDHVIKMKHVCGFLKFSLPQAAVPSLTPGSINSVTLSSLGGVKLSGDFQVSIGAHGTAVISSEKEDGDDSVIIDFEDADAEAGATYVFSVLPADLSEGINLCFTRTGDKAKAVKVSGANENHVASNSILDLKTIIPDWTPSDGEEADDSTADPAGSFDYVSLGLSSHPRILLCDEDFKRLKGYLSDGSYPELTARHEKTIAYADGLVGVSIPTLNDIVTEYPSFNVQKNRHLEELARPALAHLFACSYAYRTTGEQKYLTECRAILEQLCKDDNWYPESFLSTAEIALGVAVAYDWLYYDLTKAERTLIRQNLCEKAIGARMETTLSLTNNTGQVHNAGLMAAAIACYEKDKSLCSALMEESISNIPSIVTEIYGPKGSYFEGYSYWGYGTNFQCVYNEILLTALGTEKGLYDNAGFRNSADYRLFMANQISTFSYSDGGRANPSPSPAMWFYAAHYQRPSLLFNELRLGKQDVSGRMSPMIPCALAKYPELDTGSAASPSQSVWVDSNDAISPVVIVRKGWNGDEGDVYLGLKGGSAKVNHGHMDAGSFVYHAHGKVWSADVPQKAYSVYSDAGLTGRGQNDPLWKALVFSSLGHSTMSFANYADGILESLFCEEKVHPTDHIVDGKATIIESWTSGDELGARLDLTPLYDYQASSVKRKAVVQKDGSLRIEDEITARSSGDAKLIWRMVTPAGVAADNDGIVLSNGNKTMTLTTSCTSGNVNDLTMCNWGTYAQSRPTGGTWGWNETPSWDEEHSGYKVVGFTVTVPKGSTVVMTTRLQESSASKGATAGFENLSAGAPFKW